MAKQKKTDKKKKVKKTMDKTTLDHPIKTFVENNTDDVIYGVPPWEEKDVPRHG